MDLVDSRGKRLVGTMKRKKKKSKQSAGHLMDGSWNLIPVPLTTKDRRSPTKKVGRA